MNIEKFTQKSLESLKNANNIAIENQNSQVEQEHLLMALIQDNNGLIKELLEKMNVNNKELNDELKRIINNKPKMINNSNQNENVYISQDLEQVLNDAEKNANQMKDEYISVEHIMLGIINKANSNIANLFRTFNITKDKFLKCKNIY